MKNFFEVKEYIKIKLSLKAMFLTEKTISQASKLLNLSKQDY